MNYFLNYRLLFLFMLVFTHVSCSSFFTDLEQAIRSYNSKKVERKLNKLVLISAKKKEQLQQLLLYTQTLLNDLEHDFDLQGQSDADWNLYKKLTTRLAVVKLTMRLLHLSSLLAISTSGFFTYNQLVESYSNYDLDSKETKKSVQAFDLGKFFTHFTTHLLNNNKLKISGEMAGGLFFISHLLPIYDWKKQQELNYARSHAVGTTERLENLRRIIYLLEKKLQIAHQNNDRMSKCLLIRSDVFNKS